ncbi:hypothetical protein AAY473_037216 [Plecturocebus cupreus]
MHFNTNERPQQDLRHNHVASSMGIFISGGGIEKPCLSKPSHIPVASCIKSSTSSGGDLETLAQQALHCNCVVAAYIGNKDLETLILQALHHDLMVSSFTQRTTQSTVAQQSSQEATVLQARQPEAVLAWPISSWGCRKAARSSHGDLETLPQEALPHNHVASSIQSSTSSGGDLEILPQ